MADPLTPAHLILCQRANTMLADIMPNILALAPFESVFGLACSCRALSLVHIERAKYEITVPIKIGSVAGDVTRYTNGWRVGARITDNTRRPSTVNVVYKNNAPLAAYVINDIEEVKWVASLVTRVCCIITGDAIHIPSSGYGYNTYVIVCKDRVRHSELVDDRVVQSIAVVLRPLLVDPPGTADTIRTIVKAMNIYARHIGNRDGLLFTRPTVRALKMLCAPTHI